MIEMFTIVVKSFLESLRNIIINETLNFDMTKIMLTYIFVKEEICKE